MELEPGVGTVRERVLRADPSADPETVSFGLDFVRLVWHALGTHADESGDDLVLSEALSARTGLSPQALATLLNEARRPSERAGVDRHALRAFEARFGKSSARVLAEETRDQTTLAGFAARHGTSEALLLLDTLFAVAARRGGTLSRRELDRLRSAARDLGVDEVLVTALLRKHAAGLVEGDRRVHLGARVLSIGRSSACDICLPDPQVAQIHVEVRPQASGGWRVVDQGSGRPTLLNGAPISSAPLQDGAVLQIAHFRLQVVETDDGTCLVVESERSFSALSVRDLQRSIGDIVLLEDVSFTVFTGEVVAVVGPSGAGKTTLLNAISAITPADSGDVLLDGADFHQLLAIDRSRVGIVPQDDLVHAELTVEESLAYSGRLRFAGDVSDAEVDVEVDRVLDELDIDHIRSQRIGDTLKRGISGGQRKRVNLGQELMSRSTRVLFLDEPTSGLDPRASQDIVRLVRQLADRGRIVFLVTHDLTPEVMAQCDHLLVLVPGGRLGFFGPPSEAARYFQVDTIDAIFNRFSDHRPETWAALFQNSQLYRKYVTTRDHMLGIEGVDRGTEVPRGSDPSVFVRHLRTLTVRYARTRMRDRTGLAVLGAQPVFLAFVMAVVFKMATPGFFFMLSLSCFWFGLSGSVRELITDRTIWRREARIGVGVMPYVGSKVVVLGLMTLIQCVGLSMLMFWMHDLATLGFSLPLLAGVTGLVGVMGMAIGLVVSATWTSSEAAVGTLPLLLIPQIAFSSIIVSIQDMPRLAYGISWITFQRYAFDAIMKCGTHIWHNERGGQDYDDKPLTGIYYLLGLKPFYDGASSYDLGLSLVELTGIQSGITAGALLLAVVIVYARTKRDTR